MSTLSEFREFAARGNVIDMAVGVVVGGAFGRIVTSFVQDIMMPPLSLLTGKVNLGSRFIALSGQQFNSVEQAKAAGVATINYGQFLNEVVSFVIVAFCVFLFVREVNRLKRTIVPEKKKDPATRECPYCLTQIPAKASRCAACTADLTTATL